jgi:hypothetical protein
VTVATSGSERPPARRSSHPSVTAVSEVQDHDVARREPEAPVDGSDEAEFVSLRRAVIGNGAGVDGNCATKSRTG